MPHIKEILNDLTVDNLQESQVMPTDLTELDELLEGGLRKGKLYLIASRPSSGKTSLALTIACNLAVKQHIPIGYITCDTTNEVGGRMMNMSLCSPNEWSVLLGEAPVWVEHVNRNMLCSQAKTLVQNMVCRNNVQVVFVDALWKEKDDLLTADILCTMARELNVAFVALCPLSRNVDLRPIHLPKLPDVLPYDVSSLADVVMSIHIPEHYECEEDEWGSTKDRADIIVGKNNMGKTGIVRTHFSKKEGAFLNRNEQTMSVNEELLF